MSELIEQYPLVFFYAMIAFGTIVILIPALYLLAKILSTPDPHESAVNSKREQSVLPPLSFDGDDWKPSPEAVENGNRPASEMTKREMIAMHIIAGSDDRYDDYEPQANAAVRAADSLLESLKENPIP